MRVQRLRPAWSARELASIYAQPHDHRLYGRGHGERVDATIDLARKIVYEAGIQSKSQPITSVGDLSCGNAIVARSLGLSARCLQLGDIAPGYQYIGPIEHTITKMPNVDLYICGETIEHLDNPIRVLQEIATRAPSLVLSTPIDAWDDSNAEHYWAWDQEYVESMLTDVGFYVETFVDVDSRKYGEPYRYGIWSCS